VAARKAPVSESNASDFIRSQPQAMTAPEVVAAGKRAGFDFSASLVYAVRGRMKKSGAAAPSAAASRREAAAQPARRAAPAAAAPKATPLGGGRLEAQIQELVTVFVQQMATLVRRAALDAVREALERGR
jgi:hypothetical protein